MGGADSYLSPMRKAVLVMAERDPQPGDVIGMPFAHAQPLSRTDKLAENLRADDFDPDVVPASMFQLADRLEALLGEEGES